MGLELVLKSTTGSSRISALHVAILSHVWRKELLETFESFQELDIVAAFGTVRLEDLRA